MGVNGQHAKAIIEKDDPLVIVRLFPKGFVTFPDFCCNRVVIILDEKGNVSNIPLVG